MREFDYYIFLDYSVNLIGYSIIGKDKLGELVSRISKFSHYKNVRNKKSYISSIKKVIKKNEILNFILKVRIKEKRENISIYLDILEFLKKHENCIIFISVDNTEYSNFRKMIDIVDGNKTKIVKESDLKKDSLEYRLSLILDTLLNIERLRK